MKDKDKKTLLVGAGAVALLGLAVYASRGSGRDEPLNLGGGGGMPAVLAGGIDGTGDGTGQGEVTYNVAFPDVTIPSLPQPTGGFSDSGHSTPTGAIPTEVTHSSGKKETIYITAPPPGISSTTVGRPAGPLSQEEKDFMGGGFGGGGGGFGGGGAGGRGGATPGDVSGIPGGSPTKKGANVGADTAPGGLPGLIGGLIGGIGGLFGW